MKTIVRLDSKGRISLGKFTKNLQGLSGFLVQVGSDGSLLLSPQVEVPAREAWVHQDPSVFKSIVKGVQQVKAGKTRKLGDFSQYAL